MNTEQEHLDLYDELKEAIFTRGLKIDNLTIAQKYFVEALEQAAFGTDFLRVYSELVETNPDINIRNLHAFCIGYGMGSSEHVPELNITKTNH